MTYTSSPVRRTLHFWQRLIYRLHLIGSTFHLSRVDLNSFGVTGITVRWIKSYLSNLIQFVKVSKAWSLPETCSFNPLDEKVIFCQTPVGAGIIFRILLLGAGSIFAKLPLAPDVFSSLKNVATPRELSYL